ncbi:hypothetical protein Acr_16g0001380 [Actinidia rufa]|uniref:Uncharacterized protein n=1 Tax=Actinidia rufa TaxID=165716 RepID=A0A7J0FY73_9ERIC|nr:hypothetical protein Acr_16g0001380 [Actinidia rufa]
MRNIKEGTFEITLSLSLRLRVLPRNSTALSSKCHGFWCAALAVPAALFVLYLAFHAKNLRKFSNGWSYVMIAYYSLLWFAALLNLAWCSLQGTRSVVPKD